MSEGHIPAPGSYLEAYVGLIKQLDRDAFIERIQVPLLLNEVASKRTSFAPGETKHASVHEAPGGGSLPERLVNRAAELQVHPIRRRVAEGPNRVMLGRAGDCDVVIGDETVSMLQSVFQFDPDGRCTIEDMETTNGTLLNGTPLTFGSPTTLKDGDSLAMGDTKLVFFTPQGLYDLLQPAVTGAVD